KAFKIAAVFATVAAVLQPLSGDISAKSVARRQPAKLAAMEAHFQTERRAALIIGGIPDTQRQTVRFAIKIPGLLSFMAHDDFNAEVKGLDQVKPEDQPPVAVTHYAFQVMVGLGMLMLAIALLYFLALWKKRQWQNSQWLLKLFVVATPAGFLAVEAGWTVTEVGRQPWIINGIMRTADAVTPMPGIAYSFYLFTGVYVSLALIVTFMLYRQIRMVGKLYDLPPVTVSPAL
ncbi:MAG TPA: cytochrome ubiquinol oxidase subunit I, partial [Chitinophaga sp.]